MAEKGTYVNIQILNNSSYFDYKHFVNMKGTIYGKRDRVSTVVKVLC